MHHFLGAFYVGGRRGTRTLMTLRSLVPETSASTSSATRPRGCTNAWMVPYSDGWVKRLTNTGVSAIVRVSFNLNAFRFISLF